MKLLAIDPGTIKSGWVILEDGIPTSSGWHDNEALLGIIVVNAHDITDLAIEDITSYGMPVGRDVFETVRWTGRFDYAAQTAEIPTTYVGRKEVLLELCGSPRGKDGTLRQAVIDHYGGDDVAVGGKKCPTCKGKGWNGRGRENCLDCHCLQGWDGDEGWGCGFVTHPGVLKNFKGSHMFSALGVALTYQSKVQ